MTLRPWELGPMRRVTETLGYCYAFPLSPGLKQRVTIYGLECGHIIEAADDRQLVSCLRCGEAERA